VIKKIICHEALIIFTILIIFGLGILLSKSELPLSQKGHIETECFGIIIPENLKYTQSRLYCRCFKSRLNYSNRNDIQKMCLDKLGLKAL
jgi:hypothetical protein